MTLRAEKLAIAKLKRLIDSGHSQERIIEQSIEMGWKGLFEVKGGSRAHPSPYNFPECKNCGLASTSIKKGEKCPYCDVLVRE